MNKFDKNNIPTPAESTDEICDSFIETLSRTKLRQHVLASFSLDIVPNGKKDGTTISSNLSIGGGKNPFLEASDDLDDLGKAEFVAAMPIEAMVMLTIKQDFEEFYEKCVKRAMGTIEQANDYVRRHEAGEDISIEV